VLWHVTALTISITSQKQQKCPVSQGHMPHPNQNTQPDMLLHTVAHTHTYTLTILRSTRHLHGTSRVQHTAASATQQLLRATCPSDVSQSTAPADNCHCACLHARLHDAAIPPQHVLRLSTQTTYVCVAAAYSTKLCTHQHTTGKCTHNSTVYNTRVPHAHHTRHKHTRQGVSR
jgi:hypothetical protein